MAQHPSTKACSRTLAIVTVGILLRLKAGSFRSIVWAIDGASFPCDPAGGFAGLVTGAAAGGAVGLLRRSVLIGRLVQFRPVKWNCRKDVK